VCVFSFGTGDRVGHSSFALHAQRQFVYAVSLAYSGLLSSESVGGRCPSTMPELLTSCAREVVE